MANERVEWTIQEDEQIATLVLDFVRRGKQVKEALEEFIKRNETPRTIAAARYRWITAVKPRIEHEYELASREGIAHIQQRHDIDDKRVTPDELIDKVGEFIKQFRVVDSYAQHEVETMRERISELEEKIIRLEMERDALQSELMRR